MNANETKELELKNAVEHADRMAAIWRKHADDLNGKRGGKTALNNWLKWSRAAGRAAKALREFRAEVFG
jgi:hypothetical protein